MIHAPPLDLTNLAGVNASLFLSGAELLVGEIVVEPVLALSRVNHVYLGLSYDIK